MEWELVTEGPNHRFAGIENVLVAMYWGAPSAHSLRDRLPWAERTLETYGSLGQLVIIDRSTTWAMPTPEWRAESREQSKRFQLVLDFASIVFEPNDTKSALLRTMVRGLAATLGLDRRYTTKIFDDLHAGTVYAETHGRVSATRLRNVAEALRPHASS